MSIEEIVKQIEETSSESGEEVQRVRRALWQQLGTQVGPEQGADELFTILVSDLRIQPITVTRWLSGDYAPRKKMLEVIRQHLLKRTGGAVQSRTETPVSFRNTHVAINTLEDSFLPSLKTAKSAFVFKGYSAFRAGSRGDLRKIVMDTLKENTALHMYYFFPPGSLAEETWDNFQASLTNFPESFDDAKKRLTGIRLGNSGSPMDANPASPFVLLYGSKGFAEHGRKLDIWYELPVERVSAYGDPEYDMVEDIVTVYARVPPGISLSLWKIWRKDLEDKYQKSENPKIESGDLDFISA